jgi:CheY-like chemotaxis protein
MDLRLALDTRPSDRQATPIVLGSAYAAKLFYRVSCRQYLYHALTVLQVFFEKFLLCSCNHGANNLAPISYVNKRKCIFSCSHLNPIFYRPKAPVLYNPLSMHILILEDNEFRATAFRRNLAGTHLTIVAECQEAIEQIQSRTWDVVFLDHDLGGEIFVPSGPGTGHEVAQWLQSHPSHMPKRTILHSMNFDGRKAMKQILPDAEEVPFAWELASIDAITQSLSFRK